MINGALTAPERPVAPPPSAPHVHGDAFAGPARVHLERQRALAAWYNEVSEAIDQRLKTRPPVPIRVAVEAAAAEFGITPAAARRCRDLARGWSRSERRLLFGPMPQSVSDLPEEIVAGARQRLDVVELFIAWRDRELAKGRPLGPFITKFCRDDGRVSVCGLYRHMAAWRRWGLAGLVNLRSLTIVRAGWWRPQASAPMIADVGESPRSSETGVLKDGEDY